MFYGLFLSLKYSVNQINDFDDFLTILNFVYKPSTIIEFASNRFCKFISINVNNKTKTFEMKFAIVLFACIAIATARPGKDDTVLKYDADVRGDGYNFA